MEHRTMSYIIAVQSLDTGWVKWINEIQGQVYRNPKNCVTDERILPGIWIVLRTKVTSWLRRLAPLKLTFQWCYDCIINNV